MKKYLVFGLLAAFIALITLPHNCGNRNDAVATGIKYDVYTAVSTVPAYYAKQRDVRISKAIDINIKNWIAVDDSGYGYVYKEDDKDCAIMQVYEVGESSETLATSENTKEDGTWQPLQTNTQPMLKISKGNSNGTICHILWDALRLQEQNVSM